MHRPPLMRIATIGRDAALVSLVEAAKRSERCRVVASYEADAGAAVGTPPYEARSAAAGSRPESWEALLSPEGIDLVMVAGRPHDPAAVALRAEQLKRLVQAGIPLVLVHPPCDMLLAYELEMNRGDGGGPIHPYCPLAERPVLRALEDAVRSATSALGPVQQIIWDRFVPEEQRGQAAVMDHVARDALILRRLLGDISSVSASGVVADGQAAAASDWGNLGIHLSGPAESIARWSLGPQRQAAGARLTLVGARQTVSAWIPDGDGPIELSDRLPGLVDLADDVHAGSVADEFLRRIIDSEATPAATWGTRWDEVCRALEVTDAVQRSVRRRRTIELYHEQVTEHETFKSMMAAGGCGMLLWVLLVLLMVGIVDGLRLPLREMAIWRLWPGLLVAPLAVFLALQLLQLVFPGKAKGNRS